jgi:hypothetical protein
LLSDVGIKPKKLPVCLHITETIETTFSLYIPSLLRSVYKEKHRKVQQLDQEDTFVLFQESIKCGTTGKMYAFYLKRYMEFLDGHHRFYEQEARTIESSIIECIVSMKQV